MLLIIALCSALVSPQASADPAAPYMGRWNMTVTGALGEQYPQWLEITREGDTLKARMVGRGGSVFPVPEVAIDNGELVFKTYSGSAQLRIATVYRAKPSASGLTGTVQLGVTDARPWIAARAPKWTTPKGVAATKKAGTPVALFNGTDLTGWNPQNPRQPMGWIVKDGALDNQGRANNIYSTQKFKDFRVDAEYALGVDGNSGVYLRGRYEVQVLDDYGKPADLHSHASIYGFIAPRVNASKRAGEWQVMSATIVGNRVSVTLNGQLLIDDGEIPGTTGGALDCHEAEPGPVLLQGDHAGIRFRKVVVTPLN